MRMIARMGHTAQFWRAATLLVRIDMAIGIAIAATLFLWLTWR